MKSEFLASLSAGGTPVLSMRRLIRAVLGKAGLIERLQNSILYDLYWGIVDPRWIAMRRDEESFYRALLTGFQNGDLILDIGANCGDKTDVFVRLGARVVAVEPDESNQATIRRRFLRYRFTKKPVVVVGEAVSDRQTIETMWVDEAGSALNTLSRKWVDSLRSDGDRFGHSLGFQQERRVTTTTLENLFGRYGVPFFVKIDVEGYELNVLRGMKRAVPFLSFEVNLPEFKAEGLQCIAELAAIAADGRFNFAVNSHRGLESAQWLDASDFSDRFNGCTERAIEVFWRSGQS